MNLKTTAQLITDMLDDMINRPARGRTEIKKFYCLLSTPRSGSKMFCDMLGQTGLAGDPREWVNSRYIRQYWKCKGMAPGRFKDYIAELVPKTCTSNGVFALNMHIDQHLTLMKQNINIFKLIRFDQVYYLRRQDKVAQAWSLAKARATEVWSSDTQKPEDYEARVKAIKNSDIAREIYYLTHWEEVANNRMPVGLDRAFTYETFSSDPEGASYRQVLDDLGLDVPAALTFETGKRRQSGAADMERTERFRRELGLG